MDKCWGRHTGQRDGGSNGGKSDHKKQYHELGMGHRSVKGMSTGREILYESGNTQSGTNGAGGGW